MTFFRKRTLVTCTVILFTTFFACTKVWDDHNKITDANLNVNLYQAISQATGLGKFSELLVKSGYDKVLASSKTFTVWAPTDQALQSLDPAIVSDTARLKRFVGNHISYQSYIAAASGTQRIAMLNGKYMNMAGNTFDSANITKPNQYAGNGLFHIIDRFIPVYDNCWDFMSNSTIAPMMKTLLLSFDTLMQDNPVQIGVDSVGNPIYQQGVGYVKHNILLDNVMNLKDEAGQYTLILLTDAGFTTGMNNIKPYFKTGNTDSTQKLAGQHLVKDFMLRGLVTPSQLPITLTSGYGVQVPLTTANLVASFKTSNGFVYLMNDVSFVFANKFPPVVVEGEAPTAFAADRSTNTFYWVRKDSAGRLFNDIYLQNYNYGSYWIRYSVRGLYTTKYNVSWVALNDVQSDPLWQQKLCMDSTTNTTSFPYVTVGYQVFSEITLGQWTLNNYRRTNLYVVGPSAASSTGGKNSISLDYIKLTPLP